ncbi:MAG TPA: hypothetical protein VNO75_09235, partial [Gemmatimonadaceae bacterium]|nr:hypothetical protein [Gemmatimonadaceae bacterium]
MTSAGTPTWIDLGIPDPVTQSWSTCSDGGRPRIEKWREAVNEMTLRVTSADGTRIAYDRKGTGPAVILVGGTLDDGAENAPLARLLANHFTVYNYARRGRGASGNTPPYAVA